VGARFMGTDPGASFVCPGIVGDRLIRSKG
jgi:hypothetical protein